MATLKAIKAKEDAWRKGLQDQVDAILAANELIVEELHAIFAKLEGLPEALDRVSNLGSKGKVKAK